MGPHRGLGVVWVVTRKQLPGNIGGQNYAALAQLINQCQLHYGGYNGTQNTLLYQGLHVIRAQEGLMGFQCILGSSRFRAPDSCTYAIQHLAPLSSAQLCVCLLGFRFQGLGFQPDFTAIPHSQSAASFSDC